MATLVTKTIKSAGGDYTTVVAFESGNQSDFVALDKIVEGLVFTPTLTATATFNGSTTDATRYWLLRADATTKHAGIWDASKALYTHTSGFCINVTDSYMYIRDMQFQVTVHTANRVGCIGTQTSSHVQLVVDNCIFRENPASVNNFECYGYYNQGGGGIVVLRNCIAIGFKGGTNIGTGFQTNTAGGPFYLYNCTGYGCEKSFNYRASTVLKNCLSVASIGTGFTLNLGGTPPGTNNVSSDASSTVGNTGSNAVANATVTFVNAAADDFHLDVTDTGATGKGADLSADPDYPFSTDIDGTTIVGTWSAGADWNPVASGGPKRVLEGAILKGTVLK